MAKDNTEREKPMYKKYMQYILRAFIQTHKTIVYSNYG